MSAFVRTPGQHLMDLSTHNWDRAKNKGLSSDSPLRYGGCGFALFRLPATTYGLEQADLIAQLGQSGRHQRLLGTEQ